MMATDPPAADPGAPFCRWCEHTTDDCGFPGSDLPPCCIPCGYPLEDCALRTDIEILKAERGAQAARLAEIEQLAGQDGGTTAGFLRSLLREKDAVVAEQKARLAAVEDFVRACRFAGADGLDQLRVDASRLTEGATDGD
jgi:hypothetical protein